VRFLDSGRISESYMKDPQTHNLYESQDIVRSDCSNWRRTDEKTRKKNNETEREILCEINLEQQGDVKDL
jgi:hypothetical protein